MNGSVVTEVRRFGGRSYEKATEFLFSLDVAEQGMLLCVSDPKYVKAWKLETFKTRLTDVAEEWLHREPVRVLRDYDALTQSFLKRFPSDPEGHEEAQIEAGKLADWQQGKLTFQEYVLRTQDLARNVGPEVNRMIAVQFVSGLEDADLRRQTSSDLKAMGLRMNNPRLTLADAVGCAREAYESQSDLETLERTHARIKRKEAGFSNQTHERRLEGQGRESVYPQRPNFAIQGPPPLSETHSSSDRSTLSNGSAGNSDVTEALQKLADRMTLLESNRNYGPVGNGNTMGYNGGYRQDKYGSNSYQQGRPGPNAVGRRYQGHLLQDRNPEEPIKCYNCYEIGHRANACHLPALSEDERRARRLRSGGFDAHGEPLRKSHDTNFIEEVGMEEDSPIAAGEKNRAKGKAKATPEEVQEQVKLLRNTYLVEEVQPQDIFSVNGRKRVHIEDLVNDDEEMQEPAGPSYPSPSLSCGVLQGLQVPAFPRRH
ncbi:hypothetical protein YB2330_006616 [Saitoella coloradoensis]